MLVKFTVDPEAINPSESDLDATKTHRTLINLWERVGILIIPGQKETESKLLAALNKAPQNIKTLWQGALKHHRKSCGSVHLSDMLSELEPPNQNVANGGVQVISLHESRGELWGLTSSTYSAIIAGEFEICRFGHENETTRFQAAINMLDAPISQGEAAGAVWHNRFKELVNASRIIAIVDRYAVKDHFCRMARGEMSGIHRFLLQSAALATPTKKVIHLYIGYDPKWKLFGPSITLRDASTQIFKEFESLCADIRGNSIFEVNIHIISDEKFSSINHYRYIRFDYQSIMLLDTGLEPLGGDQVYRTCPVQHFPWTSTKCEPYHQDARLLRSYVEESSRIPC